MRCISLHQPWASLIAIGAKWIETRGWQSNYVGPLAIHAAKSNGMLSMEGELAAYQAFRCADLPIDLRQIPHGAIIAVCRLVKCVPTCDDNAWTEDCDFAKLKDGTIVWPPELLFGDYSPNRYGWILGDVKRLKTPIPWRGHQRFFNVPDDIIARALADQLHADTARNELPSAATAAHPAPDARPSRADHSAASDAARSRRHSALQ